MKFVFNHVITTITLVSLPFIFGESSKNITCYQCVRNGNIECEPHELLPCPPVSDRCVTHISKNAERGFLIKRECGLGPCGFDDPMAQKGLGLDNCDQSRNEYSCIFCCRESGCNRSRSSTYSPPTAFLMVVVSFLIYRNTHVG